jgi:23S rRNA-/tRNA-specific pseudouridylate synthase
MMRCFRLRVDFRLRSQPFEHFSTIVKPTKTVDKLDEVNVIFEDQNFFFVHKPAGIVVAGQRPEDGASFHDLVKEYALKNYNTWPRLLHRLDKETSGVMVYAKTQMAAKHFSSLQEKKGAITKEYLAVVRSCS